MSDGAKPLVSLASILHPTSAVQHFDRGSDELRRGRVVEAMSSRDDAEDRAAITPRPRKAASGVRVMRATLPPAPPLPPAQEPAMPRGVYPRKPKDDAPEKSDKPTRRKSPKRAKKRDTLAAARRAARTPAERVHGAEPNFVVDDAGRIAIIDRDTRVELSAGATKRLADFVERTKGLRK